MYFNIFSVLAKLGSNVQTGYFEPNPFLSQGVSIMLTSFVTFSLYIFGETAWVGYLSGVTACIVASIISWCKYSKFEANKEMHLLSAQQFADTARLMMIPCRIFATTSAA